MLGKVLLIGRKNCNNTIKLKKFLKKKVKNSFIFRAQNLVKNLI